jgi:3-hydroxyisobutyrate dehydrogenase-like beta-hydroxyacid dehydrogenase
LNGHEPDRPLRRGSAFKEFDRRGATQLEATPTTGGSTPVAAATSRRSPRKAIVQTGSATIERAARSLPVAPAKVSAGTGWGPAGASQLTELVNQPLCVISFHAVAEAVPLVEFTPMVSGARTL